MRRCFGVAVGVTCACFCRCAADSFCRGSVQCLLRRMHSILSRFVACTRAVLRPMCVCTGDGRAGRGVRLGCGSCRGVVCRSRRMSLGQEITNIGQYGAVEPWATARGRTERSLRAFGVAAQCDQPNVYTQLCSRGHGHDVEATHDSVTCGLGRLRHVCVRYTTHMAQQGRGGLTAGGCTYTGCKVATSTLRTASAVLQGTPLLTGEGPHMWGHTR